MTKALKIDFNPSALIDMAGRGLVDVSVTGSDIVPGETIIELKGMI